MRLAVPATLMIGFTTPAFAQDAGERALGNWARGDGIARVAIARCGERLCVTNTWIRDGTEGEKAGDRLVLDVAPSGPNALRGSAYDPQRARSYTIQLTVDADTMSTTGCLLKVLCKTVRWTRIR